jgi:hypothetical protein
MRRPLRTPEDKAALRDARDARADRVEGRLAVPVIAAAAVSVPAVFLSVLTDGTSATIGTALNWASLAVLTAESVVLFILTGHRLAWLWRHKWTLAVLAVAIPAVILVVAPAQSLRVVVRLVQFFGAIRVLRAGRIVKAGRVLARRIGWDGPWRYLPILAGSVLAAGFVAVVLSDPTSTTRRLLADLPGGLELALVVLAAAILAGATFVVVRYRRRATGSAGTAGTGATGTAGAAAAAAGSGRAGGADGSGEPVGDRLGQFDRRCLHHHPDH